MKSLRALSLGCLAALSVGAYAQYDDPALQAKVDFRSTAASTAVVVSALSEASKVKLMVSPQTGSEVVYVNVKDMTLADLMKQIALAASGEWRAEEGGYRLIRPAFRANQEANAERVERVNKIRAAIAKRVEALTKKPEAGARTAPEPFQFGGMGGSGESEKTITKLLALIDPSSIANLEKGGRIVFSNAPNRSQRAIYGNIAPIIADFIQAHNTSVRNRPKDDDGEAMTDEDAAALREFMKVFGVSDNDKPINARPAKVLLAFSRGGGMFSMFGGGGLQVELMLFDEKGEVVLKGQSSIADGESIFEEMVAGMAGAMGEAVGAATAPADAPKAPKFEGENGDIEFSKTSKELATLFGEGGPMSGNFGMPKKLSPELEAMMLRPDLHDPLSFAESDSLDSVGKIKKWNVVANLPDSRLNFFGQIMGRTTSQKVDDYLKAITTNKDLIVEIKNGLMTIRPTRPVSARAERVDRVSLARLLAASKAKGIPGLDDYALYAQKNDAPFETPAATLYLALFAPNAMTQGMMGLTDWNMIRFYGSLNPTQRAGLKQGITVNMLNLEPIQRMLLEKMLFGTSAQLKVGEPKMETEPFFMRMFATMFGGQATSWKQEPTEVMPNGLPNNGLVHMSSLESMVGKAEEENQMSAMFGALGPSEIAMFQLFKDEMDGAEVGGMMPQINKLKLGTRIEYRFLFQVAADVSSQRNLNDDSIPKDGRIVGLDQLPDDFRRQVEVAAKQLKESAFFRMATMGRARSVPPPPTR